MLLGRYKKFLILKIIFGLIVIYFFVNFFLKESNVVGYFLPNSIVFITDVSKSMDKNDVENKYGINISRFQLEKLFIKDISYLVNSGILLGIVSFAKSGYRYIPPTKDIETLNLYLDELDINQFSQGSNIVEGLKKFVFYSFTGDIGIVLSDFEVSYDDRDLNVILDIINRKNLKLYLLNVGNGSISKCEQLANILNSKCIKVKTYFDFKKINLDNIFTIRLVRKTDFNDILKSIILSLFSL